MFFLLQILALAFAVTMAKMHAPAISHFENYGADIPTITRFHRYGVWVKLLFLVACGLCVYGLELSRLLAGAVTGLTCFLWIYLLFDIVASKNRTPARVWHYLGDNDADGRRWKRWFGESAGKKKAFILIALIVVANIFYLLFFL